MLRLAMGLLVAGPAALSLVPAFFSAPAMAAPPAANSESADDRLKVDQAVAALRGIETLRANFVQRSESTGQQVTGVLSLKRPGKIRFQYQRGYPVLILSDGKALTIVDSEVKQTQRWPIGNSPMGALLNPAKDVAKYGSLLPSFDPNVTNIRVADRGHPQYGVMTLSFAHKAGVPGNMELVGWQTVDAQNRRTTILLSGHQYGVPLDDDLFKYLDIRPGGRH